MPKAAFLLSVLPALVFPGHAVAEPDCAAKAVSQKILPANLEKFMSKCQSDAAVAVCEEAATEKKLEGRTRKGFVQDCAKDTLGK